MDSVHQPRKTQSIVSLVITLCMARDFLTFRKKMLPPFSECFISLNQRFTLKMKTAWSPKHLNKWYNDQKTNIWTTISNILTRHNAFVLLTLQSLRLTICTTSFKVQKFGVLPTLHLSVLHGSQNKRRLFFISWISEQTAIIFYIVDLRTTSDYFPKPH